jgi:CRP-like cAMP-binding protein
VDARVQANLDDAGQADKVTACLDTLRPLATLQTTRTLPVIIFTRRGIQHDDNVVGAADRRLLLLHRRLLLLHRRLLLLGIRQHDYNVLVVVDRRLLLLGIRQHDYNVLVVVDRRLLLPRRRLLLLGHSIRDRVRMMKTFRMNGMISVKTNGA